MRTNRFMIAAALMSVSLGSPTQAQDNTESPTTSAEDGITYDPIDAAQIELITYPSLLAHPYEIRLTGLTSDSQVRCQLRDASDTVLVTDEQSARTDELRILFKEKTPSLTASCDYVTTTIGIRASTGPAVRRFGS